jgi:hypothetical protein
MAEDKDPKKSKLIFDSVQNKQDEYNESIVKNSSSDMNNEMMKSMIKHASGSVTKGKNTPRLAFAEDPHSYDNYAGIYKLKRGLLPDNILKQIRVQNFLIAGILRARGNSISMMGHIRKDRFDIGIDVEIKPEFKDHIEPEQMVKIQERINKFLKVLVNCGYTDGLEPHDKLTLPEFFDIQVRNGLTFGRFATEIIYDTEEKESLSEAFHRFRPVDAGTIYRSVRKGETAENIRVSSLKALEQVTGSTISKTKMTDGQYAWVQVINGMPKQAFTSEELIMYSLYPSSDVEHNGYPVTPIDTVMNSVTTHQSIEVYNKLYFQNGRAARGILVIKSDEIDQTVVEDVKQQFNANINNVTNSFRTPIFGVSKEDDVNWVSTQPTKKDGEFQFLFDQTTRNILSAFNISPDELPGFGHLSRGTNQQAMSEASNEWKITAARDTGIRPLILKIQDFLNEKLFPIIDKELSQLCNILLAGFDAETKQQESVRLQQDMPIHYDYDQILEEVDKEQVGDSLGGSLPFNEQYRSVLDTYVEVGKIQEHFTNSPAAIIDPMLKFKRDQFFFQQIEALSQYNPYAAQAYFVTRPDAMKVLKIYMKDFLDEDEI